MAVNMLKELSFLNGTAIKVINQEMRNRSKTMDIDRLKVLTENLPDLANLIQDPKISNIIQSESKGLTIQVQLYNDKSVGIFRLFMSTGSRLAFPVHGESQWVLVSIGCLTIELNGEKKTLNVRDIVEIPPETLHRIEADIDTWAVCISIPSLKDDNGNTK